MCSCDPHPNINGQPGYKWQPEDPPRIRPVDPPALAEGDTLLYDEPGRCGGIDSHCHHFRVVQRTGALYLLVKHGGGEERHQFGWSKTALPSALAALDSDQRYWMLCTAYHAISQAATDARHSEHSRWTHAVAEGRVKHRKLPKRGVTKVWIEQPTSNLLAVSEG